MKANPHRLSDELIEKSKFYSPKGGYVKLPIGSKLLVEVYYKEMQAAALVRDIPRIQLAKYVLFYCLN